MKRTITINQETILQYNLKLDIVDCVIFDFVKDYILSSRCHKPIIEGKMYYAIPHEVIMKELPLLHITTKRAVASRMSNLCREGLLVKSQCSVKYGQSLYTLGAMYDKMIFSEEVEQKNEVAEEDIKEVQEQKNEVAEENTLTLLLNEIKSMREEINGMKKKEKEEKTNEKKTLMSNSAFYNSIVENGIINKEKLQSMFSGEFSGVDVEYYFKVVTEWSDQSDTKRTNNGWIATMRTFMRKDMSNNTLKLDKTFSTLTKPNMSMEELRAEAFSYFQAKYPNEWRECVFEMVDVENDYKRGLRPEQDVNDLEEKHKQMALEQYCKDFDIKL